MKLISSSTARRRTANAPWRSLGAPQMPSPVRRIAPNPRRCTEISSPSETSPAPLAESSFLFAHMRWSNRRSLGQHIEQAIAIKSSLLTECDGFGNRLHSNSQQGVRHKLHRRSGTTRPQIKILLRDRAKNRLSGLKTCFVTTAEQSQQPPFGGRSAPRYSHVENLNSPL